MAQLIKAEVKVSFEPSQVDLADAVIPEPAVKKGKRGQKAQLHAVVDDAGVETAAH
jgi:hypothetical protein